MEEAKISNMKSFNPPKKYPVISSAKEANIIIDQILSKETTVIGIDIEAAVEMSRFGILCLFQIAFNNTAFIFDMIQMNHTEIKLQQLFSNPKVIKVFHDCLEDVSMLYNLYNIKEIKGVFDTQIAHRVCYDSNYYNYFSNNSFISLEELIKEYLHIDYNLKKEIHSLMAGNPYLWKTRPLTDELNLYAGRDVIYLPKIYHIFVERCAKKYFPNVTMNKIFKECYKYLDYVKINLGIKNFNKMDIPINTIIQGLIKNFQNYCVFIQLNIGYCGIVNDQKSVIHLKRKYGLGDIIYFKVVGWEQKRKRYVLDVNEVIGEGDKEKENSIKFAKKLNVSEKSFYPQSYLKSVNEQRGEMQIYNSNESNGSMK